MSPPNFPLLPRIQRCFFSRLARSSRQREKQPRQASALSEPLLPTERPHLLHPTVLSLSIHLRLCPSRRYQDLLCSSIQDHIVTAAKAHCVYYFIRRSTSVVQLSSLQHIQIHFRKSVHTAHAHSPTSCNHFRLERCCLGAC